MGWKKAFFSSIVIIFAELSVRRTVLGLGDFWETVNSPSFVDKSLFIEYFFKGPDHMAIIAPRRFSKTTNLNMLKAFLEIETAPNGEVVERNTTKNYKAFASHKLNIFRNAEFFKMHFGRYPVIRVDFGVINATTHQNFHDTFHSMVKNLFNEFEYLSKSKKLSKKSRNTFDGVHEAGLALGIDYLVDSGYQLADLLFEQHGQKAILLVDNFDVPIRTAIMSKRLREDELDSIVDNLSEFIAKLIKHKDHVARSLFTGCLTVGQIYALKADNLKLLSVFKTQHLDEHYGFTEADVESLAVKSDKKPRVDDIRKWYGGYYVENTHKLLYNPYSVVKFLSNGTLEPFWFESRDLTDLEPFFDFEKVGAMGEGSLTEDVLIIPHEMNSQLKLHQLKSMFCSNEFSVLYVHRLMQFLMEIGYYTAAKRIPNAIVGDAVSIGFPNEETKQDFKKLLFTPIFYRTKFNVSEETATDLADRLDALSADNETSAYLAASVEKIFYLRKPRDQAELLNTLHALAAYSSKLPEVEKDGTKLVIKRYDAVGIVIESMFNTGSSSKALDSIMNTRIYEMLKKKAVLSNLLIGLFLDKQGKCDISFVYYKDGNKTAQFHKVAAIPTTTTVGPFAYSTVKPTPK